MVEFILDARLIAGPDYFFLPWSNTMAYAQGSKRLRTEEPFIYPQEKKTKVEMAS